MGSHPCNGCDSFVSAIRDECGAHGGELVPLSGRHFGRLNPLMATGRVRAADICDRRPKAPLSCDSQLYSKAVEYVNDSLDVPHPSVIRVATTCSKSFGAIVTIAPTGTCRNFAFRFPITGILNRLY
jgi:hypothetical protein